MENNTAIKLLDSINNQLDNGKTKEDVISILVKSSSDTDEETALKIVNAAIKYKRDMNKYTFGGMPPIITLLLAYVILNVLIYGGQELYYWNDVKKCEQMEKQLAETKQEVKGIEDWMTQRKYNLKKINDLQKDIEQGQTNDLGKYQELVDKYNANQTQFKHNLKEHTQKIDKYNDIVNEYNSIAKDAYSRWWLFPFPLPVHKPMHIN